MKDNLIKFCFMRWMLLERYYHSCAQVLNVIFHLGFKTSYVFNFECKFHFFFLLNFQACASLEEGYLPPVTFVVVQKRHHTRLFPANHGNRDQTDPSGNIQPGSSFDRFWD